MPTRATRKGCGGRIMINRPCRPNRRSRLFNGKKLTQVIIRVCEEWGTDETQKAIDDALEQGCDAEERKKKKQQEADKATELKAALDFAMARLAAILAALALVECLSDDEKQEIAYAEDDLKTTLTPVTNGAAFTTGGGFGGTAFTTGGGF